MRVWTSSILLDELADCTVLVSERDKVLANSGVGIEDVSYQQDKVVQKALDLLDQLHTWRRRWRSESRNSYFEFPTTSVGPQQMLEGHERSATPSATVFMFQNDPAVITLMLYNTALI